MFFKIFIGFLTLLIHKTLIETYKISIEHLLNFNNTVI